MTEITIQELEVNFEKIIQRVEDGEKFIISSENKNVMMIPYKEYENYYDKYFDHDDAC